MAVLHDDHASDRGGPPAGRRPLRRFLVPPRYEGAGGLARPPPRPCHQTPDQQRQKSPEPSGCDTVRLLQKPTLDQHRILENPGGLLRAVWRFVDGAHRSGTRGEGPCGRDIRAQYEAARLCIPTGHALCRRADGGLQPRSQGVAGARRGGTRPAPAILRPCLTGDLQPMLRGGHRAPRRRCSCRSGTAARRLLLCGARRGLQGTLRRLALTCQPLLPSCVLRAGGEHDRPRGGPGERALALIGLIGSARTGRGRLRVGDDAECCPRVVGHSLSEASSACIVGGGSARAAQGVAQGRQMLFRHQRRRGNGTGGSWSHAMLRQEWGDVRQEGVMHGCLCGMALGRFAPAGYGTIHTEGRADTRLQVGPLVLALTRGDPNRPL
jgi:hypothetical protein